MVQLDALLASPPAIKYMGKARVCDVHYAAGTSIIDGCCNEFSFASLRPGGRESIRIVLEPACVKFLYQEMPRTSAFPARPLQSRDRTSSPTLKAGGCHVEDIFQEVSETLVPGLVEFPGNVTSVAVPRAPRLQSQSSSAHITLAEAHTSTCAL